MSHPSCTAKSFYVAGVKVRSAILELPTSGDQHVVPGTPSGPDEISAHQLIAERWSGDLLVDGKLLRFDPSAAFGKAGREALADTLAAHPTTALCIDPTALPKDSTDDEYCQAAMTGLSKLLDSIDGPTVYAQALHKAGQIDPIQTAKLAASVAMRTAARHTDQEIIDFQAAQAVVAESDAYSRAMGAWAKGEGPKPERRFTDDYEIDQYMARELKPAQALLDQKPSMKYEILRYQAAVDYLADQASAPDPHPAAIAALAQVIMDDLGGLSHRATQATADLITSSPERVVTALDASALTRLGRDLNTAQGPQPLIALATAAVLSSDPAKRKAGLNALGDVYAEAPWPTSEAAATDPLSTGDYATSAYPVVVTAMADPDPSVRDSAVATAIEMSRYTAGTSALLTDAVLNPAAQQTAFDTLDRLYLSGSPQAMPIVAEVCRSLALSTSPEQSSQFTDLSRRAVLAATNSATPTPPTRPLSETEQADLTYIEAPYADDTLIDQLHELVTRS